MGLGDPEPLGDLVLAHVREVAAAHDLPLTPMQRPHAAGKDNPILADPEGVAGIRDVRCISDRQERSSIFDPRGLREVILVQLGRGLQFSSGWCALQSSRELAPCNS